MPGLNRLTWHDIEKNGIPENTSAVINLAGQNVLDPQRRWTPGFQQNVWNSRINTTKLLALSIENATNKPNVFINISGVSLYRPDDHKIYNENDTGQTFDYMSNLCVEWEKAATLSNKAEPCRQIKIRTGVVLGREGGMIKSLILPFFFGVGGKVATGAQPLPWIHIDDLCNLIKFAIENNKVNGVLNGVAPDIITNNQFTKVRVYIYY